MRFAYRTQAEPVSSDDLGDVRRNLVMLPIAHEAEHVLQQCEEYHSEELPRSPPEPPPTARLRQLGLMGSRLHFAAAFEPYLIGPTPWDG